MLDVTAALPTFVITLREGVEAALVVGIVLAYLNKADQSALNPWVWGGVGGGLAASGLVGVVFAWLVKTLGTANQTYAPVIKPLLQGGFSIAAIALLSWMLIWMTQQSRQLKAEIEGTVNATLHRETGAGWGIFGLIFFAVLREGFETVIFIAANLQQGWLPIGGAIAGLLGATIIGILLFQLGIKINVRQFFQVMGLFLLLIVAGLVVSALAHIDIALTRLAILNPNANFCLSGSPDSCILGPQLWDTSSWLPDRQFPGLILHILFGYEAHVYLIEVLGYLLFWSAIGTTYLRSLTNWQPRPTQPAP